MSATLDRSSARRGGPGPGVAAPAAARTHRGPVGDATILAVLAVLFAVVVMLTWRRWGQPEIDSGAELTTADLIRHGAVAYGDVRYFYGPLGLYSLALAFTIFGTSFTTVYAFGLLQALAILGTFYTLARHWLAPLVAGLATGVLLTVGFSGTAFNFVLPHTNSATFGLLCLLAMLLALASGRLWLAGIALGLVGLTRPEFLAVAAGAGGAYVLGTWRFEERRSALGAALRLVVPGLLIPGAVLGAFAAEVGSTRLITTNLWPTKFLHASGFRMQQGWMPLSVSSVFGLLAQGQATACCSGR